MRCLVFVGLFSLALARPGILSGPLIATLTPGAQVGPDGRVLDTPEVAVAKAEHAAAQINERINLANEAARSGQLVVGNPLLVGQSFIVPGAPIGPDGRVQDTPEVAVAKAAHAAAQINERINLANEAVRTGGDLNGALVPVASNGLIALSGPSVGPDGRIQDTPAVAAAKAAHAIAQQNERQNLANKAARSAGLGQIVTQVLVPGAPIGPDGRVLDTPEVAVAKAAHAAAHVNEKLSLANEAAKSADVLAVAGPGLAIGRIVY